MKSVPPLAALLACLAGAIFAAPSNEPGRKLSPLAYRETEYLWRWSKDDQHEFTPREQENLERWDDMITINHYRRVTEGEGLAATANAVLETYARGRAIVIRTSSVPRTKDKPAEHLIVVLFPQPEMVEAAFARFKMTDGMGTSVVYSHREYGPKAVDRMGTWLNANGAASEEALMSWEGMIPPQEVEQ